MKYYCSLLISYRPNDNAQFSCSRSFAPTLSRVMAIAPFFQWINLKNKTIQFAKNQNFQPTNKQITILYSCFLLLIYTNFQDLRFSIVYILEQKYHDYTFGSRCCSIRLYIFRIYCHNANLSNLFSLNF